MSAQIITIPFDEKLLPTRKLSTPSLNCLYEHGSLRYVRCGETEVVRMIYFAVRDKDWNTVPYQIENESIQISEDGFSIRYHALHELNDIIYRTEVVIKAEADAISFSVKGEAISSFKRNRIGICVLHPIDGCAGIPAEIQTQSATKYIAPFPTLIAPHQPFRDVKKMEYAVADSVKVSLSFEGDIFETEDQRNWADSSFKTYSTPVDLPMPVDVTPGDKIEQTIGLKITGTSRGSQNSAAHDETTVVFPKIGYGCTGDDEFNLEELSLLKQLPFDHYRVELVLYEPKWKKVLQRRLAEATQLRSKLELILFFDDDFEIQLQAFLNEVAENFTSAVSILPLQKGQAVTPLKLLQFVYEKMKMAYPLIEIGYGSDGFFADINRNRPGSEHFDFLSFPLCPQVHASDSRSLMENLERQRDLYETAQSFALGKKVHISPVTFKIRTAATGSLPVAGYDARLHSHFGSMWTLYTIRNLARADRLTFYDTKGILSTATESPLFKLLQQLKSFDPVKIVEQDASMLNGKVVMENGQGKTLEFDLIHGADFRNV